MDFDIPLTLISNIDDNFGKYPLTLGNVAVVEKSLIESLLKESISQSLSNPTIYQLMGPEAQRLLDFVNDLNINVSVQCKLERPFLQIRFK